MSAGSHTPVNLSIKFQHAAARGFARLPHPLLERLGRNAPTNAAGDTLAPEIHLALSALNRLPGSDYSKKSLPAARRQIDQEAMVFGERKLAPFAVEEDLLIPGAKGHIIPATRYRHRVAHARGLIIYFHGGGWVLGSLASNDSVARFLAVHTGADVLSVDYRLAPEHPFPAAIEDGLAAWDFAVRTAPYWGIDPAKLVVAGDSAGGNMAAVLALELRGHPNSPALQVAFCPVTDLSSESGSYEEFAEGYFLSRQQMRWYKDRYLARPADAFDPRASPLLAPDVSGAAPAYIGVAGFDPLRDEGILYAEKLKAAGVPVILHRASSAIHAYINVTAVSAHSRRAGLHAAAAIVDALDRAA